MTRFYALLAATLCALTVFVAVASSSYHTPTTHDHGDAPPAWLSAWLQATYGHGLLYGGAEATPNEDQLKHSAYKGYTLRRLAVDGTYVDVYLRVHEASNPLDRQKQYHSYQMFARDSTGSVSMWQGWLDRGDPATERFSSCLPDPVATHEPGGWVKVVDTWCWNAGVAGRYERWYSRNADWAPDVVEDILDPTTRYHAGETATDAQSTWDATGLKGVKRRAVVYWYGADSVRYPERNADGPQGWFCAMPTGELVTCGTPGSLDELISPSLPSFEAAVWTTRTYSGAGIGIPN